jgi:hypothetical protein
MSNVIKKGNMAIAYPPDELGGGDRGAALKEAVGTA